MNKDQCPYCGYNINNFRKLKLVDIRYKNKCPICENYIKLNTKYVFLCYISPVLIVTILLLFRGLLRVEVNRGVLLAIAVGFSLIFNYFVLRSARIEKCR